MNSDSVCSIGRHKFNKQTVQKATPGIKKGRDVNDTQPMQKGFCAVQIIVAAQRGAAHESASQYMKSSSSPFLCRRGSGLLIYSSMLTSELLRFIYAPLSFSHLLLPISP